MEMTNHVKGLNSKKVTNFMGGASYRVDPITTLKIVTASSIFGEPQYYRKGAFKDGVYKIDSNIETGSIIDLKFNGKKTSAIMEAVIDEALDYDFKQVLTWAATLRQDYYMRLNPQIILVRAAIHKKRATFNKNNPNFFRNISKQIIRRGDEPASQLTYYLFIKGSKNGIPTILKKVWKDKIESLSKKELNKYKHTHIGIIDTVRICHANNEQLNDLLNNKQSISTKEKTWQNLRSEKSNWKHIVKEIKLPHMAMLNNLNGVFKEVRDSDTCNKLLNDLKAGVTNGKLFPYRYYQAYNVLKSNLWLQNKTQILDALEDCMDISLKNLPRLKGKTVCLSDNSGSAWGQFSSSYGTNKIAVINNLSSVITASTSDSGEVVKFGDTIKRYPISSRNGVLYQAERISEATYGDVGGRTENGIWLFFKEAIAKKIHYDNIFIYSDQQAGTGGLYGINPSEYEDFSLGTIGAYIDLIKLVSTYRNQVNSNLNVFSIQTAGYDNVVLPQYLYRTSILTGWTGKESLFANKMIEIWDETTKNSISLN